jgi:hypothetical protein
MVLAEVKTANGGTKTGFNELDLTFDGHDLRVRERRKTALIAHVIAQHQAIVDSSKLVKAFNWKCKGMRDYN